MAFRIRKDTALGHLQEAYGCPRDRAKRVLNIAWEFGIKTEPCAGGYVTVRYHGKSPVDQEHLFSLEDHTGGVARRPELGYTQGRRGKPRESRKEVATIRRNIMPPRGRSAKAAAAEAEPVVEEEGPFDHYLTEPFSPTMQGYIEWFNQEVGDPADYDADRLLVLGIRMYKEYQTSDFNRQRREARRAERAVATAGNGQASEEDEEETPAAPAKPARGRGRTAKAAAAPAAEEAPAAAKPPRRRGRPAAAATAAPY